jgi:hypothetical protein
MSTGEIKSELLTSTFTWILVARSTVAERLLKAMCYEIEYFQIF